MTPETFNAALATRKLEAIDILLIQAKRGSDADRIRAASAILRIAFFPTSATDRLSSAGRCSMPAPAASSRTPEGTPRADASQAVGLKVHSRGQSDESSRRAAPGAQPIASPTPRGSYSGVPANPTASTLNAAAGAAPTSSPAPDSPFHRLTGSPSHASTPTPLNFTTPRHVDAHPLPPDPSQAATFPPRGLIITPNPGYPFPPQTPTSLATQLIHYEVQHQFSSA